LSGDCVAAIGDVRLQSPLIRPLIPNARAAGFDYFRKTGIYPINHTITIRDAVLAEQPGIARDLFQAFTQAKIAYYAGLRATTEHSSADAGAIEIQRVLGIEPFPYGLDANLTALNAIMTFASDQQILKHAWALTDVFATVE
jgi:4,5-dihydroxyphthalate decarboxylase